MADEVLTIEVAALVEKTVYAIAQASESLVFEIRGQWRIKPAALERWMDAQARGRERGGGDDDGR
jgi:hypothetical protein